MEQPNRIPAVPAVPTSFPQETERLLSAAHAWFERIFVPVDYSPDSHRVVGVALELQRVYGSEICLFDLHNSNGSDEYLGGIGFRGGDGNAVARGGLRRFVDNIAPGAATRVETRALIGGDAERTQMFLKEAAAWRATLVVLTEATHSLLFRSVAESVVRKSDLAVLVLPSIDRVEVVSAER